MRQERVMKKLSFFFTVVALGLAACERHPASQLEERGAAKENKSSATSPEQSPTPGALPGGTPKSYFPQNS
jgi:hypothetical protein